MKPKIVTLPNCWTPSLVTVKIKQTGTRMGSICRRCTGAPNLITGWLNRICANLCNASATVADAAQTPSPSSQLYAARSLYESFCKFASIFVVALPCPLRPCLKKRRSSHLPLQHLTLNECDVSLSIQTAAQSHVPPKAARELRQFGRVPAPVSQQPRQEPSAKTERCA